MNLGASGSSISIEATCTIKTGPGCKLQAQKMIATSDFLRSIGFESPQIFTVSNDGYSMETIHGQDAISFLHSSGAEECQDFLYKMVSFVRKSLRHAKSETINFSVVSQKVFDVHQKAKENPFILDNEQCLDVILRRLAAFDDKDIPIGPCHGDLTLSNVIVRRGELVLIDSIPVFINSPMLDAAKLLQDARHHWTTRTHGGRIDHGRMLMLMAKMESMIESLSLSKDLLNFFSALNLYRILPYVRENQDVTRYVEVEILKYG